MEFASTKVTLGGVEIKGIEPVVWNAPEPMPVKYPQYVGTIRLAKDEFERLREAMPKLTHTGEIVLRKRRLYGTWKFLQYRRYSLIRKGKAKRNTKLKHLK